jgi:hypothetical protein
VLQGEYHAEEYYTRSEIICPVYARETSRTERAQGADMSNIPKLWLMKYLKESLKFARDSGDEGLDILWQAATDIGWSDLAAAIEIHQESGLSPEEYRDIQEQSIREQDDWKGQKKSK